jgi:hypothetical protein
VVAVSLVKFLILPKDWPAAKISQRNPYVLVPT